MASRHAYKEVRLQQLRSFCETARLGSLTAAAAALGLAQPTVWEQVHALEAAFSVKLVERRAHGCRLTDAGRLLAELAAPLVAGVDSLGRSLEEARGQDAVRLTVAATPRIVAEDLPPVIAEFQSHHPRVVLRLLERASEQVTAAVESAEADLGLTAEREPDPPNPRLLFEPGYELDVLLLTPLDHPLARKRRLVPADVAPFPLVNAPDGILDEAVRAALEKHGVFRGGPRRVEVYFTAAIRRYVELGFGLGLLLGLPTSPVPPGLRQRSLSQHLGRVPVSLVWRKGDALRERGYARAFAHAVRTGLQRPVSRGR